MILGLSDISSLKSFYSNLSFCLPPSLPPSFRPSFPPSLSPFLSFFSPFLPLSLLSLFPLYLPCLWSSTSVLKAGLGGDDDDKDDNK